jgi:hypothetical protein
MLTKEIVLIDIVFKQNAITEDDGCDVVYF